MHKQNEKKFWKRFSIFEIVKTREHSIMAFLAMVVGSIFLHEMGHAWGCLVQGIPVTRIVMYGGGGLCERSRSASRVMVATPRRRSSVSTGTLSS